MRNAIGKGRTSRRSINMLEAMGESARYHDSFLLIDTHDRMDEVF
jgi:hypothetical protein